MPPIPPPRDSGLTTSTATPLYWCAYGPAGAPKVLVVHGGPGAHHDYLLPQMLELADERELIFYDQRGGGRSKTDDPSPIGWREHVEDLGRVATELGVDPLVIIGYSWGGLLTVLYALEVHEQPSIGPAPTALALIDPAPIDRAARRDFEAEFTRRMQGPVIQGMRAELAASGLRESDPATYRQRAFELSVAGYFYDPARAHDLTPFRVMGKVQESVWASLGDFDLRPRLPALRGIPAFIAHGREDPIPLASSEALAALIGAELDVLAKCGHVPYVEQPASLFDGMRRFLAAQGSRR